MSFTTGEMSPADFKAVVGNDDNFGANGGWWIWIIILFLFGRWGYGNGNGGENGVQSNYVLASDFATLQRMLGDGFNSVGNGLDTIRNGICDGFYTEAQLINGVNTNIMQGTNTLQSSIQANTTQSILNTKDIQSQIAQCCCDNEKMLMQNRFDMSTYNCNTLQAIDKLGDRIIDYMNANEKQNLRDENFALKLSASQRMQNNYLIGQLRPSPIPSYVVANPYCCNTNCNC